MKIFIVLFFSLLAGSGLARADNADNLLPVDQAFTAEATATDRQTVQFRFTIADDYYLYRGRIKTKGANASTVLGALDLPAGEKKHDEFLGDVEVYHHGFTATQHLDMPAGATQAVIELRYQGCHEVDPKICFPPQKKILTVALPAATAAPASLSAALGVATGESTTAPLFGSDKPLPVEQAFRYEAIATGPGQVLARFTMPKGYYLYRDRTGFSVPADSGITLGAPKFPKGVEHSDANFGQSVVYFDQVEIPVPLARTNTAAQTLALTANFQGCKENSVCYPMTAGTVEVSLPAGAGLAAAPKAASTLPADTSNSQFKQALDGSLWLVFGVFFLAGLGLAFTPCVFPMIPILSGIIAGAGAHLTTRRAIALSLVYILANAVIFTIAGVIAGLAGHNLQAAFQTPWVLWSFAGLFVLLALSMFGFFELQLPGSWQAKLANASNRQSGGSLWGVAIMGALSALIVGPCVTPPLAVAVLYIAQKHDAVLGGLALFALALGMGAPLVAFGAGAGKLLPRAGAWMDAVKAVFGVVFLGLAIWMLSRILDTPWIMLLSGLLLVACAVYLGALERLADGASGWKKMWKALGVALLIGGAAELIGAAAGSNDLLQPLRGITGTASTADTAQPAHALFRRVKSVEDVKRELAAAKATGKPVLLDFYADWCVSCKEMEKFVFARADVRAALADFVLLQADVTANDDTDKALMAHFDIVAPPDTLFFGADGIERHDLQLTGPENADKFLQRLATALR